MLLPGSQIAVFSAYFPLYNNNLLLYFYFWLFLVEAEAIACIHFRIVVIVNSVFIIWWIFLSYFCCHTHWNLIKSIKLNCIQTYFCKKIIQNSLDSKWFEHFLRSHIPIHIILLSRSTVFFTLKRRMNESLISASF